MGVCFCGRAFDEHNFCEIVVSGSFQPIFWYSSTKATVFSFQNHKSIPIFGNKSCYRINPLLLFLSQNILGPLMPKPSSLSHSSSPFPSLRITEIDDTSNPYSIERLNKKFSFMLCFHTSRYTLSWINTIHYDTKLKFSIGTYFKFIIPILFNILNKLIPNFK